ncbi:MAG: ATP-binding protein [Bacteroidales bacterium]|nr:ATP-binding protein [Bacteroidales bacterium]
MDRNWITRYYQQVFPELVQKGKVLIIYGPRRSGKTELIRKYLSDFTGKLYMGSGDDIELRELISSQNTRRILSLLGNYDLVFIDEAQKIPDVGNGLKILVDNAPECKIIITGSSSLDLARHTGEPLTGRQKIRVLFPLSVLEIYNHFGGMDILQRLEELMIYGSYPETITSENLELKKEYLITLRNSYLFKDIFELENIRNSSLISDLLKLLAFQIGNEVSLSELASSLGIARQTIERYLYLLEKSFIIKKVTGFSRNLRSEVTKTSRYYFYDNGVRNALINNFNPLDMRNDTGMLWENLLFIERVKLQHYKQMYSNNYFWRTYDKKEIDHIEERDGKLFAYEFKWGKSKVSVPKLWKETYPDSEYQVINKENFLDFLI